LRKTEIAIIGGTGQESLLNYLEQIVKVARKTAPILEQVLREPSGHLPTKRQCPCAHALEGARF